MNPGRSASKKAQPFGLLTAVTYPNPINRRGRVLKASIVLMAEEGVSKNYDG